MWRRVREGVQLGAWGTSGPGGWAWACADNALPAQPRLPAPLPWRLCHGRALRGSPQDFHNYALL